MSCGLPRQQQCLQVINAKAPNGKPKHLARQYDKKVHIAALVAVMAVPEASLPRELAAGLPHLLAACMHLLMALKQQQVCTSLCPAHVRKLACCEGQGAGWLANSVCMVG